MDASSSSSRGCSSVVSREARSTSITPSSSAHESLDDDLHEEHEQGHGRGVDYGTDVDMEENDRPMDLTRSNNETTSTDLGVMSEMLRTQWGSHKKLIGIRYLFPPMDESLNLLDRARIWVARHDYKYFVDWSERELDTVDLVLRPLSVISKDIYKLHMNRSEYCRNVKLKYCLQSTALWAQAFRDKLTLPAANGGFTGLCQAKITAAELWRKYSEHYRSHQARRPNNSRTQRTSMKSTPDDSGIHLPDTSSANDGTKLDHNALSPSDVTSCYERQCGSCDSIEHTEKESVRDEDALGGKEMEKKWKNVIGRNLDNGGLGNEPECSSGARNGCAESMNRCEGIMFESNQRTTWKQNVRREIDANLFDETMTRSATVGSTVSLKSRDCRRLVESMRDEVQEFNGKIEGRRSNEYSNIYDNESLEGLNLCRRSNNGNRGREEYLRTTADKIEKAEGKVDSTKRQVSDDRQGQNINNVWGNNRAHPGKDQYCVNDSGMLLMQKQQQHQQQMLRHYRDQQATVLPSDLMLQRHQSYPGVKVEAQSLADRVGCWNVSSAAAAAAAAATAGGLGPMLYGMPLAAYYTNSMACLLNSSAAAASLRQAYQAYLPLPGTSQPVSSPPHKTSITPVPVASVPLNNKKSPVKHRNHINGSSNNNISNSGNNNGNANTNNGANNSVDSNHQSGSELSPEYRRSERGLSFLFPSFSDHSMSLIDKVKITIARHKNNYFLGWDEAALNRLDPIVRPKMTVTPQIYKEYCHRNAMKYDSNLQFAMESVEPWADDFRAKLTLPPSEGGFSSLCEVKLEAGRLWREYSGKYRMHNIVKWQMDMNCTGTDTVTSSQLNKLRYRRKKYTRRQTGGISPPTTPPSRVTVTSDSTACVSPAVLKTEIVDANRNNLFDKNRMVCSSPVPIERHLNNAENGEESDHMAEVLIKKQHAGQLSEKSSRFDSEMEASGGVSAEVTETRTRSRDAGQRIKIQAAKSLSNLPVCRPTIGRDVSDRERTLERKALSSSIVYPSRTDSLMDVRETDSCKTSSKLSPDHNSNKSPYFGIGLSPTMESADREHNPYTSSMSMNHQLDPLSLSALPVAERLRIWLERHRRGYFTNQLSSDQRRDPTTKSPLSPQVDSNAQCAQYQPSERFDGPFNQQIDTTKEPAAISKISSRFSKNGAPISTFHPITDSFSATTECTFLKTLPPGAPLKSSQLSASIASAITQQLQPDSNSMQKSGRRSSSDDLVDLHIAPMTSGKRNSDDGHVSCLSPWKRRCVEKHENGDEAIASDVRENDEVLKGSDLQSRSFRYPVSIFDVVTDQSSDFIQLLWRTRAEMQDLLVDSPIFGWDKLLAPFLPTLQSVLGGNYVVPATSAGCAIDLVFAVLLEKFTTICRPESALIRTPSDDCGRADSGNRLRKEKTMGEEEDCEDDDISDDDDDDDDEDYRKE